MRRPAVLQTPLVLGFLVLCLGSGHVRPGGARKPRVPGGPNAGPAGVGPVRSTGVGPVRSTRLPAGELVIVATTRHPWLAALAAPVAARRAAQGQGPPLLLVGEEGTPAAGMGPQLARLKLASTLVLAPRRQAAGSPAEVTSYSVVETGTEIGAAARLLTRRFWSRSPSVVVARATDMGGIILGATLAAHKRIPLLLQDGSKLEPDLNRLGARQLLFVLPPYGSVTLAGSSTRKVVMLDRPEVARLLVRIAQGRGRIRSIVVTREPLSGRPGDHDPDADEGVRMSPPAAWLGPYYSLARNAPLILLPPVGLFDFLRGKEAERAVATTIRTHRLRPRSLAILGDRYLIGEREVTIPTSDPDGPQIELGVPPCRIPPANEASGLGIGRFPLGLPATSRMILRAVARRRWIGEERPRATIIANPNPSAGPLPLCETVARVSTLELRNRRVRTEGVFGRFPTGDLVPGLERSHLILYQGHSSDRNVFRAPLLPPTESDQDWDQNRDLDREESPLDDWEVMPSEEEPSDSGRAEEEEGVGGTQADPPVGDALGGRAPAVLNPTLHSQGVVILQSCSSLDEVTGEESVARGVPALVGSVTRIHSASGSTFINALIQALIHRGSTLGEALRDAGTYYDLLHDLKRLRGHVQQAKGRRVALSFRLWGDPELRVFPRRFKPRRPEPTLAWVSSDTLTIRLPRRRLRKVLTEHYLARPFPGGGLAGIVKRRKRGGPRRLVPILFHRLDLPRGFLRRGFTRIDPAGARRPRSAFRIDPIHRALYVVHLTAREKPGSVIRLRFRRR